MEELEVGVITHYFDKVEVAGIQITSGELSVGDNIHIKGHTTDVTLTVDSMQIEHQSIETAKEGDEVGIKITEKVRENDKVFKVTE